MTNSRNCQALEDSTRAQWPGVVVYDIGDPAHATGVSDHNPDDTVLPQGGRAEQTDSDTKPEVRATDTMRGPRFSAADARDMFERLTRRPENQARLSYVIYNRRIRSRRYNWQDRPYSGSDPHTDHVHTSTLAAQDNNARPFNLAPDTPPEPPTPEVQAPMTIRLQSKTGPAQFLDNGRHITSSVTAKAMQDAGVPLIQVATDAELASLLPLPVVAAPIDVAALAAAIAALLPANGLTEAQVRQAVATVLIDGAANHISPTS